VSDARYVHTNLVARDWKALVRFYVDVFGCTPKPPERNLAGGWLDGLTGLRGARIQGIHLRLPGFEENGPTLEIFQYSPEARAATPAVNAPGFGHIAFAVKDVGKTLEELERHGGSRVGRRVSAAIEGVGTIDVVYARDPEGNIVELQRWE
jgi:catechol 2,3-dioxygenase-like lactoylglutathione lyase family enzyme